MKKKSNANSLIVADDLDIRSITRAQMRKGIMGKYYREIMAGSNLVRIAPELNEAFPNEESVNRALRELLTLRQVLVNIMEPAGARKRRKIA